MPSHHTHSPASGRSGHRHLAAALVVLCAASLLGPGCSGETSPETGHGDAGSSAAGGGQGGVGGEAGSGGGHATCDDGTKNGGESDIDCGGDASGCPRCGLDQICTVPADCDSGVCLNGACQPLPAGMTYFVAPDGDDASLEGDFDHPFATLNQAWTVMAAGDIVYLRGGTYGLAVRQELQGISGSAELPIRVWSYPNESPVLDGGALDDLAILQVWETSYLHVKGIRLTNLPQPHNPTTGYYGLLLFNDVTHSIFERVETDHIGGWGVTIGDRCSDLLFLNCDSHHNADPYSNEPPSGGDPYGGSDGFETGSHGADATTDITFKGCRAWSNSDDGWDLRQADGTFVLDGCWSFWNGYIPDTAVAGGNGDGFKLGGKTAPPTTDVLRTITRSLAFGNRGTGITPEPDGADLILGVAMLNCTAYDNAGDWGNGIASGGYGNVTTIRNCIAYSNHGADADITGLAIHDHNTFDLPLTVTDADFASLDPTGMDGPRGTDGSLPVLDFLRLAPGSALIDAGVDVGLPYESVAPDLGAFEH